MGKSAKAKRKAARKLLRSRRGNPIIPDWMTARKTAIAMSRKEGRFYFAKKAPGGYEIMASSAKPFAKKKAMNRGLWEVYDAFPTRALAVAALRANKRAMPQDRWKIKVNRGAGRLKFEVWHTSMFANRGKAGRPFRAMHARVAKAIERKRREYFMSKEEARRRLHKNSGPWRTVAKVSEAGRAAKYAKALRKRTPAAETRISAPISGLYHVEARIKSGMANPRRRRRNPPYGYGRGVSVTWNRKRRNAPSRRRRRNPSESGQQIGTAPSLTIRGQGALQFPRGVLKTGPTPQTVRLILGGSPAPRPGAAVTRIEYDDPVKAVAAYKEIGRFRHDCADPFIVGPSEGGSVLLASKSKAWQGD